MDSLDLIWRVWEIDPQGRAVRKEIMRKLHTHTLTKHLLMEYFYYGFIKEDNDDDDDDDLTASLKFVSVWTQSNVPLWHRSSGHIRE